VKARLREYLKYFEDMVLMVIEVITVDQDIIKVGYDKDIQIGLLDIIDEVLEAGQYIGQAKRHYQ
jgi:hypothetical protein